MALHVTKQAVLTNRLTKGTTMNSTRENIILVRKQTNRPPCKQRITRANQFDRIEEFDREAKAFKKAWLANRG